MTFKTIIFSLIAMLFTIPQSEKPTVYLVGDSTVSRGSGPRTGLWGWGAFLADELDTTQVAVVNRARGGRSSRSYISEGLWNDVHDQLDSGDYVIIQFGHNDGSAINDNHRARGSIKGNGEEFEQIDNMITGRREIVKSYGWYIRKYIADTKAKGAIPIVCSLVARNQWEGDSVIRSTDSYVKWAREAAEMEGAYFIDLNDLVASKYEELGQEYVSKNLFLEDHTHTTEEGAIINAKLVAEALRKLEGCGLAEAVK